jgi:hypothetical protein
MTARVTQRIVLPVRAPSSPAFGFPVWVGTIGGAALATDPSPNVTPPAGGRIVRATPKRGGIWGLGRFSQAFVVEFTVVFAPIAAANITVQLWFFDATQGVWVPMGAPQNRLPTGVSPNSNIVGGIVDVYAPFGSQMFVQITANANVQAMAYDVT